MAGINMNNVPEYILFVPIEYGKILIKVLGGGSSYSISHLKCGKYLGYNYYADMELSFFRKLDLKLLPEYDLTLSMSKFSRQLMDSYE